MADMTASDIATTAKPTQAEPRGDASLLDVLSLQPVPGDPPSTVLESRHTHANLRGAIFGGALLGQVAAAAAHGLPEERALHSLQMQFLAAGLADRPIRYEVRTLLNGRNFTSRQVLGTQGERIVCSASAGFHAGETSPARQATMPEVPPPEGLAGMRALLAGRPDQVLPEQVLRLSGHPVLDLRPIDGEDFLFGLNPEGRTRYWVRACDTLPDAPAVHAAALAYLSDFWFPVTAVGPHVGNKFGSGLYMASLNHSLWFHRPARADDWLLFDAVTPNFGDARGITTGHVYDRAGRLLATMGQEGLYRGWPATAA